MTPVEFLRELRGKKVRLWVDGERLRYSAPRGVVTGDDLETLRTCKDEIIRFLRKVDETTLDTRPPVTKVDRTGRLPLSFSQQRLWLLAQIEPESAAYNQLASIRVRGHLEPRTLAACLNAIVGRHEVLRTVFPADNGHPVQLIHPITPIALPIGDLRSLPAATREAETRRFGDLEGRRLFDLARGPLLRTALLRLDDDEHVLILATHHIVTDDWSMGVLMREMGILYDAFSRGESSPLPGLPIQYADFAAWQREYLTGSVLEKQLAHWKQQLHGAPSLLELPTDRPRPPVQTHRGAAESVSLSRELSDSFRSLGQREGATLFMTLLAAFQTLLHRYAARDDILVGTPIANRSRIETEGLIGFFVNTLALRVDFSGHPTFRELLARVRDTTLSAYAHQDIPFEQIVDEVRPERSMSHSPLFQVMFLLQNEPRHALTLPGLTLTPLSGETNIAKFDLTLDLAEQPAGLAGSIEYNTDLFDRSTIRRMVGHFETLCQGIVRNPDERIGSLPMLTDEERHQLLVEWNDTRKDYAAPGSVHELFEARTEETPEAVALVFEDQALTYRALNQSANRLAHHLRSLGVGPESLVGIRLERSLDMVIGLLAILKAGGAYVPLDPSHPEERLAFMIRDAGINVLVTRSSLQENSAVIARQSPDNPAHVTDPQNAAYVIYTSGSTGAPKAVMNTHAGIVNRLLWMQDALSLTEADTVLQKTPFTFDVSLWEFFWPLITGARLVMAKPEGHKDPAYLVSLIEDEKITTLHFVPSMLQAFVEEPGIERCTSLGRVVCSGEALPFSLQQRFFSRSAASLYNLYGPTEAAVDVTFWQCRRQDTAGIVPIGKPIANTRIHVVNDAPAPVGAVGEIHIGGAGVARGYLNRGDLTAERFVPDPYGNAGGGRLYCTGDRARYLPDGAIDFLGRIDHQVKIRGFRIEPGEIEAVLMQHPNVSHAVVTATRSQAAQGGMQLAAYLVKLEDTSTPRDELRRHLLAKLPEYMVPQVFVTLDALPLTPSGKLDRKALPEARGAALEAGKEYVAPRTDPERRIAAIWQDVLRLDRVGVYDNFFEVGGHSLLATQVIARVRSAFDSDIPMRGLFESPTVARLAELVEQRSTADFSSLVAIQARGSRQPFFCVHPVQGTVFSYYNLSRHMGAEHPFYGLQAQGLEETPPVYRSIEAMAAHYIDRIREVQPHGPYALGGWSAGGVIAFEMAQQLQRLGERASSLALMDSYAPGDGVEGEPLSDIASAITFLRGLGLPEAEIERFRGLGSEAQVAFLLEQARKAKVVPEAVTLNHALLAWHVRNAMVGYRPAPFNGRTLLLKAGESPHTEDPANGWLPHLGGSLEARTVPATHATMLEDPNCQVVARELRDFLNSS